MGLHLAGSPDLVRIRTARTRPEFSGHLALAKLLDTSLAHGGNSLSERLASARVSSLAEALRESDPTHQKELTKRWGQSLQEILSLSQEKDSEIFYAGLLQIGRRLEDEDQLELAAAVYSTLVGNSPRPPLNLRGGEGSVSASSESSPPLNLRGGQEGLLPGVLASAQTRLNAISGVGDWRQRIAFMAERLSSDALRPDMFLAMSGAGAIFRLTRLAATAGLASSLAPALGLKAAAYGSAFLMESLAFTGLAKSAGAVFGYEQKWDVSSLYREWAGGALTLLGFKAMGRLAQSSLQYLSRSGTAWASMAHAVIPPLANFTGILLGHELEEQAGFRSRREGDTWFVDALATLIHLGVAGQLQTATLGKNLRGFELGLDLQTEQVSKMRGFKTLGIQSTLKPWLALGAGLAVFAPPALSQAALETIPNSMGPEWPVMALGVFSYLFGMKGFTHMREGLRRFIGDETHLNHRQRRELEHLFHEYIEVESPQDLEPALHNLRASIAQFEKNHWSPDRQQTLLSRILREDALAVQAIEHLPDILMHLEHAGYPAAQQFRALSQLTLGRTSIRRYHRGSVQEIHIGLGYVARHLNNLLNELDIADWKGLEHQALINPGLSGRRLGEWIDLAHIIRSLHGSGMGKEQQQFVLSDLRRLYGQDLEYFPTDDFLDTIELTQKNNLTPEQTLQVLQLCLNQDPRIFASDAETLLNLSQAFQVLNPTLQFFEAHWLGTLMHGTPANYRGSQEFFLRMLRNMLARITTASEATKLLLDSLYIFDEHLKAATQHQQNPPRINTLLVKQILGSSWFKSPHPTNAPDDLKILAELKTAAMLPTTKKLALSLWGRHATPTQNRLLGEMWDALHGMDFENLDKLQILSNLLKNPHFYETENLHAVLDYLEEMREAQTDRNISFEFHRAYLKLYDQLNHGEIKEFEGRQEVTVRLNAAWELLPHEVRTSYFLRRRR